MHISGEQSQPNHIAKRLVPIIPALIGLITVAYLYWAQPGIIYRLPVLCWSALFVAQFALLRGNALLRHGGGRAQDPDEPPTIQVMPRVMLEVLPFPLLLLGMQWFDTIWGLVDPRNPVNRLLLVGLVAVILMQSAFVVRLSPRLQRAGCFLRSVVFLLACCLLPAYFLFGVLAGSNAETCFAPASPGAAVLEAGGSVGLSEAWLRGPCENGVCATSASGFLAFNADLELVAETAREDFNSALNEPRTKGRHLPAEGKTVLILPRFGGKGRVLPPGRTCRTGERMPWAGPMVQTAGGLVFELEHDVARHPFRRNLVWLVGRTRSPSRVQCEIALPVHFSSRVRLFTDQWGDGFYAFDPWGRTIYRFDGSGGILSRRQFAAGPLWSQWRPVFDHALCTVAETGDSIVVEGVPPAHPGGVFTRTKPWDGFRIFVYPADGTQYREYWFECPGLLRVWAVCISGDNLFFQTRLAGEPDRIWRIPLSDLEG